MVHPNRTIPLENDIRASVQGGIWNFDLNSSWRTWKAQEFKLLEFHFFLKFQFKKKGNNLVNSCNFGEFHLEKVTNLPQVPSIRYKVCQYIGILTVHLTPIVPGGGVIYLE